MTKRIGDGVASWIRTTVPVAWAALVTLLLEWWTSIPSEIADWIGGEATVSVVTLVILAGWYALWRWLEPRLPTWLDKVLFGLSGSPVYSNGEVVKVEDHPVHEDESP